MILLVDKNYFDDLTKFCSAASPLGTKILSLCQCYGFSFPFMDTWLQYDDKQNIISAILRLDGAITVVTSKNTDTNELSEFVSAVGFNSLTTDYPLSLENVSLQKALTMKYCGTTQKDISQFQVKISASLYDVYEVMKACQTKDFEIPSFDGFYVDMSYRMRHNGGECAVVYHQDKAVACALASCVTESQVLLSGVACCPEYRRLGFGGAAVQGLINHFFSKNIFVMRFDGQNQNFYHSLDFVETNSEVYVYNRKF